MPRGGYRPGAGRKPLSPEEKEKRAQEREAKRLAKAGEAIASIAGDPYGDKEWLEAKRRETLTPARKRRGLTTPKPKTLDEEERDTREKASAPPPPSSPPRPKTTGRPSGYKPEYAAQAEKLCRLGATDEELADFFDVERTTIWRWAQLHDAFCNSIKAGKDAADERVVRALYAKAVGYTYDAVKIFMPANAAEPVYAPYKEHVPPSENAARMWLINRRPEEWRDKREVKHSGQIGRPEDLTDDELYDIATGRSAGTAEETAGAGGPDRVH